MAIDSTGGRLSPENIKDVLLRAELYREIRAAQTKDLEKNWFTYEIQPSETLMPELIAYRAYSMDTLKWVIMIAAALDDPRERVEAGTVLTLPTTAWLRERIRTMRRWKRRGLKMNWKELQQMAKEFDREARKEMQDAGEHRADAVGLLTPALLRKHIKSGTDLVLAYGRKGATVSYTVDDLKRFVEARERADKAFRPEPRGVPLAQLENASREADRQRSQEVKSALLYKVSGNMLFFQVPGEYQPPLPCPRTP